MLKDKLGIVLITYNREKYLKNTLDFLFAENSPIKDCDITVLDNHSTDGTSELIDRYCIQHQNLRHIVNKINIGGNPNIAKAYAEYSGKKYIWLLCDNDKYCWDNFSEIENAINQDYDVIFTLRCQNNPADIFYKASFAPACIYKTANITPTVVENIYDNIRFLFPHLAIIAYNMNKYNKIYLPNNDTIIQIINPEDNRTVFNRGIEPDFMPESRRHILWLTGFINSTELITDKKIRTQIIERCRHYHKSLFELFKTFIIQNKYDKKNYKYNLTQVFRFLNFSQKLRFILAYLRVNFSSKNYKYYEIRTYDDWSEYLDKIEEQKYIDILSQVLNGKKVLLYGAGIVAQVLIDKYNLTNINIIGISDKKFETFKEDEFKGYKAFPPSDLKKQNFDYILFTMKLYKNIEVSLRKQGIVQKALPLIKNDRKYILRIE